MFKPRFYQQEAHDVSFDWMKKNTDPIMISIATGGGKSIIVSMLAKSLHKASGGKRVLCLCPSKELTQQNYDKYIAIGEKASIYSASISKSMRHPVVFATGQSFIKIAKKYAHEFCAIIPDECHKIDNTFLEIVSIFREANPNIRICGLSATPYRMGTGYIYELDDKNRLMKDAIEPFYKKMVYSIGADELITLGFLTPPTIGVHNENYDTSDLKIKNGKFDEKQLADIFEGKSVTSKIVDDLLKNSISRKRVLIFATTINHADEISKLIPDSKVVSGKTGKKDREEILKGFASGEFKYLINVAILTTGYDLPILDCIAILRPTLSAGLYQQIVGRGTRLAPSKSDFLVLDYAGNIEQFFDGKDSIFEPNIKIYGQKESVKISFSCPDCGTMNESSKRNGFEDYSEVGGFAIDLAGDVIMADNEQPMPAHHARRCCGVSPVGKNQYRRCEYWWAHKTCPSCQHKNDIAARNCSSCGFTLIDPDEKLNSVATVIPVGEKMTVRVNGMEVKKSSDGAVAYVTFDTQHGDIKCRFFPTHAKTHIARHWWAFKRSTEDSTITPKYIEYTRQESGYCSINRYMREGLAG